MTAAVLIAVCLNPLSWLAALWAAKAGILTLRRPAKPRPPKEPQP